MNKDSMCKYLVRFPANATDRDFIRMQVRRKTDNIESQVMLSANYDQQSQPIYSTFLTNNTMLIADST